MTSFAKTASEGSNLRRADKTKAIDSGSELGSSQAKRTKPGIRSFPVDGSAKKM